MIDPKAPKPTAERRSRSDETRSEEARAGEDQPMYATGPESSGDFNDPQNRRQTATGGGWEIPAVPAVGTPGRGAEPGVGQSTAADAATVAQLSAALAQSEAKAKESHEQYLRAHAEMENVRRRAQEDVSKAHKFAIEGFAESLLPVRDSLEMALTVEAPSVESFREGVEATLRQLTQAFERHRLLVIDPLHQKFDPNRHQAISVAASRDVAPNHVLSVLQKGYMINDRILRPALVTVSQSD